MKFTAGTMWRTGILSMLLFASFVLPGVNQITGDIAWVESSHEMHMGECEGGSCESDASQESCLEHCLGSVNGPIVSIAQPVRTTGGQIAIDPSRRLAYFYDTYSTQIFPEQRLDRSAQHLSVQKRE